MMKLSSRRRWLYAVLVVLIGFILLLALNRILVPLALPIIMHPKAMVLGIPT